MGCFVSPAAGQCRCFPHALAGNAAASFSPIRARQKYPLLNVWLLSASSPSRRGSKYRPGPKGTAASTETPQRTAEPAAPALKAAELFPRRHIQSFSPALVLYFPIGVLIAVFRMLLWVSLLAIDQPWLTNNDTGIQVLQSLLGLQVTWHNLELMPRQRHVIVSNHVATGDLMMLYGLLQPTVHLVSPGLPKAALQAKHHRVKLRAATLASYDSLASGGKTESIHLFPEGGMTNGRGMMTFTRGFMRFAHGMPVVPVALRVRCSWGISSHTLTSSFLANLFWFSLPPVVRLDASVLPAAVQQKGESKAAFVQRVQQSIADELRIPIVDYNNLQKQRLVQRLRKIGRSPWS